MSLTAVVRSDGVGAAQFDALTWPVTWAVVENALVESTVKLNPAMAVAAIGETAMSPVM